MLPLDDLDDLIDAINSLRSPWWTSLLPILSAIVGVVGGFTLSRAGSAADRRAARQAAARETLAEKRQVAVDRFGSTARNLCTSWQVANTEAWEAGAQATVDLFLSTGVASDASIRDEAWAYFTELRTSLWTWRREVPGGTTDDAFTKLVEGAFTGEVDDLRVKAQRWVSTHGTTEALVGLLIEARRGLDDLAAPSEWP